MGVGVDVIESEGKGGAAGFGGDAGLRAGADGAEEVFELEAEGLAFGDVGLGEGEAGGGVFTVGGRGPGWDALAAAAVGAERAEEL